MASLAAEISYRPYDQRICRVVYLIFKVLEKELFFPLIVYRVRSRAFNNPFFENL